ncbi:radical SAM superfamily protein [Andreesenia angusta]|uniref:Radical SAM superfamily protein n=1 Tax=Andreesenia angusta TaxID=39480 RepID=A0A1S1V5T6_9FIRM|nr:radical SAM protein [Andreesenia angusta]OHW61983.1 radical SAM superfamily protein [Andreesenia angusta]
MKVLMVAYDNDSFLTWFPQGLAYLAKACLNAGHDVEIYQQDIYHYPDSHLTEKLDRDQYDIVIVSVIGGYYQYRKLISLSEAINKSVNRENFKYLIGGHGPAADPEYFLRKTSADFVGIGEGEITIVELLNTIQKGLDFRAVDGIAFMKNGNYIKTNPRELVKNIDEIDYPAWDLFNIDHYSLLRMPGIENKERSFPVLSGRGCTFECNFCYRMDKGFRPRSAKSIIDEINILKERYAISYIIFSDELLMSSKERTRELCEAFIEHNVEVKWECNGRLNYADEEILRLMKKAGCVFINYGIESLDNDTLKVMNKALTKEVITRGIENTLKVGISPGFNIIYGNINEPLEAIDEAVEFLFKYDDHAQLRTIRPVTPYPGTPLFEYAIEKGYLKDIEDFYENKHTNSDLLSINFTKYSDEEVYDKLNWANKKLIDKYIDNQKTSMMKVCDDLYRNKNSEFRGFRQT